MTQRFYFSSCRRTKSPSQPDSARTQTRHRLTFIEINYALWLFINVPLQIFLWLWPSHRYFLSSFWTLQDIFERGLRKISRQSRALRKILFWLSENSDRLRLLISNHETPLQLIITISTGLTGVVSQSQLSFLATTQTRKQQHSNKSLLTLLCSIN